MDHTDATLDQFDYCSKAIAKLFRTFGVPAEAESNLQAIAVWGADPTRWCESWVDRIAADEPVSIRPWKGADLEWSGRCANFTAAWLLAQLWQQLFPDNPQFDDLKADVPKYIKKHRKKLTERWERLAKLMNRNEWITLAEKMEIERTQLLKQVQSWPTLTPHDLRTLFHIEQDALVRRLKAIPNERITTKAYRVDPTALPDGWKQTLKRD